MANRNPLHLLHDRAQIKGSARITKDGYFVADALVARADNIQVYSAHELGLTDRDPQEAVRVFRPASEVFHRDAMASLAHRPVTLDHPAGEVSAANWRELAVGDIGDEVVRDGQFVRVPLKIMDAKAIDSVKSDRREFSLGYTLTLDATPGEHAGQAYDAVARDLRYNHLAAVRAARGGTELRIIDERTYSADGDGGISHGNQSTGDGPVATKNILVDGLQVEVTDQAEAAITKLQGQLTDAATAQTVADAKIVEQTATIAAKDEKIADLEAKLADAAITPAKLRDAAKAYADTCAKAKALGVTFAEDADANAIMRAVVDAKMGDAAKGYTDDHVAIAFTALTKDAKTAPDPLRDAIIDGVQTKDADAAVNDAYSAMVDDMTNAWKPKQAA